MSLYDELLELVIEDDPQIMIESVLSKAGLSKEDLQDPEKVKKAINNLNGITSEYEKRSAIISIITSIIQTIAVMVELFGNASVKGKAAQALSMLIVQIISEIAKYHLGVSDYRKLLNKIDGQIKKTTNKIAKLNEKENNKEIRVERL